MDKRHNVSEKSFKALYKDFLTTEGALFKPDHKKAIKEFVRTHANADIDTEQYSKALRSAMIAHREVGLGRQAITAILLYRSLPSWDQTPEELNKLFETDTISILQGLVKASDLYKRHLAIENENFRKLLLTIAQDVRVIMIMIVERLETMRHLDSYPVEEQLNVAKEVSFLYAPLAHRMGLYKIKTELEDLSLKYTARDTYKEIAKKLNETKRQRETYIANFIDPVKALLEQEGLKFSIKGRTKSIHSIWNKIRKQQVPFEKVYDLFAIRIIIDRDIEKDKAACWQAFSVVTNMYSYNTNRLRDWISAPKSNGYESLHVTVMGPEGKWVEVQIRTKRMDEIAEKGVAAHWKYKGGKSDSAQMDEWLKNLRDLLETSAESNSQEFINEFKMQLYDDDVFVFTPKGDLHRLSKGATVLDFAFAIHSRIGSHCMGAIVNNKHVTFKYVLQTGDQVSVITSPYQTPKRDWLLLVRTSKPLTQITHIIMEMDNNSVNDAKQVLATRHKTWKL